MNLQGLQKFTGSNLKISDKIFYIQPMFGRDGIKWPTYNFTEKELKVIDKFLKELSDYVDGVSVDSITILDNDEEEE